MNLRCRYTIKDMLTTTRDHLKISLYNFKQIFYYPWNYEKTYAIPIRLTDDFMMNSSWLIYLDLLHIRSGIWRWSLNKYISFSYLSGMAASMFRSQKNGTSIFYFSVFHFNIYIKSTKYNILLDQVKLKLNCMIVFRYLLYLILFQLC